MHFTWIPFYKEFAQKLLAFRKDRKALLDILYNNREVLHTNYLHESSNDELLKDIDPFTTIGIIARGTTREKRLEAISLLKEVLKIQSAIPSDFCGIPCLNNQRSHFFRFRENRKKNDIENLWVLFEKLVNGQDIKEAFNNVIKQSGININITMGLFWVCPDKYLSFDKTNREYLSEAYDIEIPNKVPLYDDYVEILNGIETKMKNGEIKHNSFYELSYRAWSEKQNSNDIDDTMAEDDTTQVYDEYYKFYRHVWQKRKNIILQGAPGTGKTYRVPRLVAALCQDDFKPDTASADEVMDIYNRLKEENRVRFTTFHQSMEYEDWMEGLKPVVENNQVSYEVVDGIFKQLCDEASKPVSNNKGLNISSDAIVWKVSLYGTGDNPIRKDCMQNGYIRIGWDDYGEHITDETDWSKYNGEGKAILNAFINTMKEGDIVMSCYTNRTIDAIGIVTGGYEWNEKFESHKRVRRVKWLVKGINEDIVSLNDGRTLTLSTVYRLNAISLDKVKGLLDKYEVSKTFSENKKPYIMVIDEINRGNVSKIFGELITLLEPDKRNSESVILPYSRKPFTVPSNVYIIATMNTADRSLGTLDYAIRRRFAFVDVKPWEIDDENFNVELFREVSSLFISNYDEYAEREFEDTLKLIPSETLSEDYRPEDVWIGHSYFIMNGEEEVRDRLLFEIIPLLKEYMRDGILLEDAQETIDKLYNIAMN